MFDRDAGLRGVFCHPRRPAPPVRAAVEASLRSIKLAISGERAAEEAEARKPKPKVEVDEGDVDMFG